MYQHAAKVTKSDVSLQIFNTKKSVEARKGGLEMKPLLTKIEKKEEEHVGILVLTVLIHLLPRELSGNERLLL